MSGSAAMRRTYKRGARRFSWLAVGVLVACGGRGAPPSSLDIDGAVDLFTGAGCVDTKTTPDLTAIVSFTCGATLIFYDQAIEVRYYPNPANAEGNVEVMTGIGSLSTCWTSSDLNDMSRARAGATAGGATWAASELVEATIITCGR